MTRPHEQNKAFQEVDTGEIPAPRFEWTPAAVRPVVGVSHADVSDHPTMEIPRVVD